MLIWTNNFLSFSLTQVEVEVMASGVLMETSGWRSKNALCQPVHRILSLNALVSENTIHYIWLKPEYFRIGKLFRRYSFIQCTNKRSSSTVNTAGGPCYLFVKFCDNSSCNVARANLYRYFGGLFFQQTFLNCYKRFPHIALIVPFFIKFRRRLSSSSEIFPYS